MCINLKMNKYNFTGAVSRRRRTNWIMERASTHKSGPNLHTPRHNLFCSFGRFWKWNVGWADASKGNKLLCLLLLKNKFIPLSLFLIAWIVIWVSLPPSPPHTLYMYTQHAYIIGERWRATTRSGSELFQIEKCKTSDDDDGDNMGPGIGVNESMWSQFNWVSFFAPFWNRDISHRILNTCSALFHTPTASDRIKRVTRPLTPRNKTQMRRPKMDFLLGLFSDFGDFSRTH